MFRLLRLTFALIATFAAAIFVARRISSTQPSPLAVLFTNPDGTPCERPCLFGIRPGKTTRAEAIRLLKANPIIGEFQTRPHFVNDPVIVKSASGPFSGKKIVIKLWEGREESIQQVELYLLDLNSG